MKCTIYDQNFLLVLGFGMSNWVIIRMIWAFNCNIWIITLQFLTCVIVFISSQEVHTSKLILCGHFLNNFIMTHALSFVFGASRWQHRLIEKDICFHVKAGEPVWPHFKHTYIFYVRVLSHVHIYHWAYIITQIISMKVILKYTSRLKIEEEVKY